MPIYEYKCTNCDFVHEEFRYIDGRKADAICPKCSSTAKFIISAPAGIDGGHHDGYRHITGSTGTWKEDMGPQGKRGREWYGDNPHASSTLEKK